MREAVTLSDVAREAGVSPSTVSRVINGTARVDASKRDAVLKAIERLNYQPNIMAQGLAQGRSLTVGVITQEISSPYYGEMLRGVEQALEATPYHPIFASGHWRADQEEAALKVLVGRRVDALVVMDSSVPEERLLELVKKMPVVVIGRQIEGLSCLSIDNAQGAYEGTRHLIELGHRRIAHIAGPHSHPDAIERLEGYRAALQDADVPFDPALVVEGDYLEPSGVLAVESLLARGALFTAIFAANDQMAYGANVALYRRGIRVPHDVSLVGFDDLLSSSYFSPPLTSVRQPSQEMGWEAARWVLAMLEGKSYTPRPLSTRLIVRESTTLLRSPSSRLRLQMF
ncbi:LacI family DNA-binding transcriptional regulator [Meiothermus hypogaeus]|uniref:LacI family transcriptional regulator n=2 Tax=Meiothermus hypogaeus TaxID=884155 RepID=A0A511R1N7_9DEIN|nr:substrate-binding domain-containing protein [Meiothermus hypogaeus]RIH76457.1 Catabolite control protein A [Meiothermus hypogaeus]GEM83523.1 LacI family transcriptional regulator [Meiothermus hypogaeus NBRC 106114]GIW36549.1 MAG: LacI family transcriptional regulator [Meiothermus sp.]